MPYLTSAQFAVSYGEAELSELTDDDGSIFTAAEAKAASMIDGFLQVRYTLPLAYVPELVLAWAGDITRFRLWADRAPQEVRDRYEDAVKQLTLLAAGRMALPPDVLGVAADKPAMFQGESAERVFTAESLADY